MTAEDRDPFDAVQRTSRAFQELLRQRRDATPPPDQAAVAALTGDDCGPPVFDLEAIWRAALADDACPGSVGQRRHLSPRRFVNRWADRVGARDDSDGRIRVDEKAAFTYCQHLDCRVEVAAIESYTRRQDAAVAGDPVGAALRATEGGLFGWMFIAHAAAREAGLTVEELREAVLQRARADAADLDDIAAESLLSRVQQAIGLDAQDRECFYV
jgi:hypothetical protein